MGIIEAAVKKTEGILTDVPVKTGIILLEADGMRISVRVWVPTNKYTTMKFALYENILKDIKAAGIKLPGM